MGKMQQESSNCGPYVYLDPVLVRRRHINLGLSQTAVVLAIQISPNTAKAVFRGEAILADTARRLAQELKCRVTDLLAPRDPGYVAPAVASGPLAGAAEWQTEEFLEPSRVAANGLHCFVCRMQHRYTNSRQGRGKFYCLSLMSPKVRDEIQNKLSRHPEVCTRVGAHPGIVVNLTSAPASGDAGWWVIDDWVGRQTLADRLESAPWPASELPRLLLEIVTGLQALHAAGVIFRELAPARVLISERDGRAVLTDFELARLLDGSPSVSSEWPEDPYRAPEVDGGNASVQADLYSFGRLAVAAAAGQLVDHEAAADALNQAGVPKRLIKLLMDCQEPAPQKRPSALAPLQKELTIWQKKVS
jgi:serine/threonine protein kinase